MFKYLESLLKLQELDLILDGINKRLEEIPQLIEAEESRTRELENSMEEAKDGLNSINLKIKEKEMNLQEIEQSITKSREQLNTLKSNEAYRAMQHEIESKIKGIDDIESEILVFYDDMEAKQQAINKLKAELEEKKNLISQKQNEYKQEIAALEENKKDIESRIKPVEEEIKPELLEQYRQIRVRRDGVALVTIDDSSCGGCHRQLPPQVVNEVLKEENLVRCESCSRFLYMDES